MPFKVEVGPPQIAIHHGQTVLVTDLDAQIDWPSDRGPLLLRHARSQQLGDLCQRRALGSPERRRHSYYSSKVFLTNRTILTEDGAIPAAHARPRRKPLHFRRHARGPGYHQQQHEAGALPAGDRPALRLRRYLRGQVGQHRAPRTDHDRMVGASEQQLCTTLSQCRLRALADVSTPSSATRAVYANGRLSFEVSLAPGEAWHCCLLYSLTDGDRHFPAPDHCVAGQPQAGARRDARRLAAGRCSRSAPATRSSIASIARRSRTWRRCGCPSPAPTTWCSCPQPACPGSLHRSAATA